MKAVLIVLAMIAALCGCSDSPQGRWEVTASIDVYAETDDVAPVIFSLAPGEVCSLGEGWSYQKVYRFKRVSCGKGSGWVMTDDEFREISDNR